MKRAYEEIAAGVSTEGEQAARMAAVVEALWAGLRDTGVSWLGFYVYVDEEALILGPREPKPACSPIGMHGACGQVFTSGEPLLVRDVAELGENYIACDPRDQSEVVIPCKNADGTCWGVLDLDSFDVGSFDEEDVAGLMRVLRAAGLTAG